MISQKRIEEIKQLCKKAVKGPWWTNKRTGVYSEGHEGLALEASEDMLLDGNLDTLDFIAASRTIIPELLTAYEELRLMLEKLGESALFYQKHSDCRKDDAWKKCSCDFCKNVNRHDQFLNAVLEQLKPNKSEGTDGA